MLSVTRGNGTEAAVLAALVDAGYGVLMPFGEGHPYDLVVSVEDAFVRVQCQTAWRIEGCLRFNTRATDHGQGRQSYHGRADVFGVYFPDNRRVYLVPVAEMRSDGRLRLEPTRNNQRRGVRFARDYEIERWSRGALLDLAGGGRQIQAAAAL